MVRRSQKSVLIAIVCLTLPALAAQQARAGIRLGVTLRNTTHGGAEVKQVEDKGLAHRMGMRPGDVILKINRHLMHSAEGARKILDHYQSVAIIFRRGKVYYRGRVGEVRASEPGGGRYEVEEAKEVSAKALDDN